LLRTMSSLTIAFFFIFMLNSFFNIIQIAPQKHLNDNKFSM
jgi:hypothetical protein